MAEPLQIPEFVQRKEVAESLRRGVRSARDVADEAERERLVDMYNQVLDGFRLSDTEFERLATLLALRTARLGGAFFAKTSLDAVVKMQEIRERKQRYTRTQKVIEARTKSAVTVQENRARLEQERRDKHAQRESAAKAASRPRLVSGS